MSNRNTDKHAGVGDKVILVALLACPRAAVTLFGIMNVASQFYLTFLQVTLYFLGGCFPLPPQNSEENGQHSLFCNLKSSVDPSKGNLQVVGFPVLFWLLSEVIGTEGIQQKGNEQIENLRGRRKQKINNRCELLLDLLRTDYIIIIIIWNTNAETEIIYKRKAYLNNVLALF